MSKLAIYGGEPVRKRPMPSRPQHGIAERNAANYVAASGNTSGFLAGSDEGGPMVQKLEREWAGRFESRYAVTMNSGTSCLFGALYALRLAPTDEVIVPPWSMSASATCVLAANATPVFADIDPTTYCLDPKSVRDAISPRTKAIVVVHLFGRPAPMDELGKLADEHDLVIVEDAAQAIGATIDGTPVGAMSRIGVFSLNRHKTIECEEGGVAVTNDATIADRLRKYRNHGEVTGSRYWGGNYRMLESAAAVASVQLERLDDLTEPRIRNANRISEALEGVVVPAVPDGVKHVYYLYAVQIPGPVDVDRFAEAMRAEGVPASRYVEPLYELPALKGYGRREDYSNWRTRLYPNTELVSRRVLVHPHVHAGMTDEDVDDVISTFRKVWQRRLEL